MNDSTLLKPCPGKPNCVCSTDTDKAHAIAPLAFSDSPVEAWERLKVALASMARTRIAEETDTYLRAESVSRLLRFVDDIECALDAASSVIHVRSASRVGHSDFGVNRKRVETLREAFEA